MSWDAITAISQLVGAIAVVATLIYLSIQIRQGTAATRSATFQNIISQSIAFTGDLSKNPELVMLFRKGMADLAALSEIELARFDYLLLSLLRRFEIVHYQGGMGFIEPGDWEGLRESLFRVAGSPGGRAWWKDHCGVFNSGFRVFIENELCARPVVVPDGPVAARDTAST
jgi:hypothetical protein